MHWRVCSEKELVQYTQEGAPLWRYIFESSLVLRVYLRPQGCSEDKLSDATREPGMAINSGPKKGSKVAHPAKNALKGKLVTRIQYKNCAIPDSMRKTRNESMNFSLFEVLSEYAFHRDSTALAGTDACCFTTVFWGAIRQIRVEYLSTA